jgi:hypothetical protein
MDRVVASIPQAQTDTLFCALELSKKTLLGIQFPDREQPSVYPIKGGDSEGLLAKLGMATDRCAKISGKKPSILICYEAGYDAFWLAQFLKAHGIQCLVIDSSMQVNRRSRRAKTDRIDLGSCYARSSPGAAASGMCGRWFASQASMKKTCAAPTGSAAG